MRGAFARARRAPWWVRMGVYGVVVVLLTLACDALPVADGVVGSLKLGAVLLPMRLLPSWAPSAVLPATAPPRPDDDVWRRAGDLPRPDRRAVLRSMRARTWAVLPLFGALLLGATLVLLVPSDLLTDGRPPGPGNPPVWFVRVVAGLLVCMICFDVVPEVRLLVAARGLIGEVEQGRAPRHVAHVVGHLDDAPVVELDGGARVTLRRDSRVVARLNPGDLVVLDGPLRRGATVVVTTGGRVTCARVRTLARTG